MATKNVFVFENGSDLIVFPPAIQLSGGRDGMKIINTSSWDVEWIVPPGPFNASLGHKEKVHKNGGGSSVQHARRVRLATAYQVIGTRRVRGLVKRKKAKANSDPIIIIDI